MNVWLCPVKPKSWRIIKSVKVFGLPTKASAILKQIKPGDQLIFHVFKPINGIIAMGEVDSYTYEDHSDLWGKNRYPFRVKLKFNQNLLRDEANPIPITYLFGKAPANDVRVEPYLKNVWITKISKEQYKRLRDLFRMRCLC